MQQLLHIQPPPHYSGPGTHPLLLELTPEPSFPLPGAGVTLAIPTTGAMTPGDRLDLYRVDPDTSQFVPEPDATGNPVTGTIDAGGVTATFNNVAHLSTIVGMVPATIQVAIDIKPGDDPASIQPSSNGKTPVAILSSATFNAPAMVDQSTLTFGHTGDELSLSFCSGAQDVNGDGLPDLVCHFDTRVASFQPGDVQGVLKGKTVQNIHFQGMDAIRIVP